MYETALIVSSGYVGALFTLCILPTCTTSIIIIMYTIIVPIQLLELSKK